MKRADRQKIADALRRAGAGTSSHIAVHVVADSSPDTLERAKSAFLATALHERPGADAALILVAPKARAFAVIGDRALDERVGQAFWDDLAAAMAAAFKSGSPADAVVLGVDRLGAALHQYFPASAA